MRSEILMSTKDIRVISGTYGSQYTPCKVICCDATGWYAVEGSVNVNQAPDGYSFKSGVNVEEIPDVDTMTAGSPVSTVEDLAELIEEQE